VKSAIQMVDNQNQQQIIRFFDVLWVTSIAQSILIIITKGDHHADFINFNSFFRADATLLY
jgi:hypothetical protein